LFVCTPKYNHAAPLQTDILAVPAAASAKWEYVVGRTVGSIKICTHTVRAY